jgi:hypothetical protein
MSRAQRGESNLLADMGIASPPATARNVTVENFLPQQENFLPQQRWQWGMVTFVLEFPERKIHDRENAL